MLATSDIFKLDSHCGYSHGMLMVRTNIFCLYPISGRGKGSFSPPKLQTVCEAQPVSHSVGTTGSFLAIKWFRHEADYSV